MRMKWWQRRKSQGSQPVGGTPVMLYPSGVAQYFYQEKQTYPWPPAPAHEQRSALTNCWAGNQMPGYNNFIPGVAASHDLWNIPTSYMNTLKNVQYNRGMNIQLQGQVPQSDLLQQALANWQNRINY